MASAGKITGVKKKIKIVSELAFNSGLQVEPIELKRAFLAHGPVWIKQDDRIIGHVTDLKIEDDKVLIEAEIQEDLIGLKSIIPEFTTISDKEE